jgi:excinuclease UvrABC helicase subunit UvrB
LIDNISQPNWIKSEHSSTNVESEKLVNKLKKEMEQAAVRLDFERAATLRDRIFQINNATDSK